MTYVSVHVICTTVGLTHSTVASFKSGGGANSCYLNFYHYIYMANVYWSPNLPHHKIHNIRLNSVEPQFPNSRILDIKIKTNKLFYGKILGRGLPQFFNDY